MPGDVKLPSDPPLVDVKVTNPVTYFKKWWAKIIGNEGIDFRLKEFVGIYKNEEYGNFSKYKNSAFQESSKDCLCRIKELIIGPNGSVYKCHRDLYAKENELIKIKDKNFNVEYKFRECNQYGQCHPCDVKVKTNSKQNLGYCSVEINDIN